MSKTVWKEQADKWWSIESDWQGRWNIFDLELEQEIERIAGVIAWIFHNMSQGYAKRFATLDVLKKRYGRLERLHDNIVSDYMENDWYCRNCGSITYYPEYDVEGLEHDAHYDCGCPEEAKKAAKNRWADIAALSEEEKLAAIDRLLDEEE